MTYQIVIKSGDNDNQTVIRFGEIETTYDGAEKIKGFLKILDLREKWDISLQTEDDYPFINVAIVNDYYNDGLRFSGSPELIRELI